VTYHKAFAAEISTMQKKLLRTVLALLLPSIATCIRLSFVNNEFKIAQFTDMHFGEGEAEAWGPKQDDESVAIMQSVLAAEAPNLVVLGGDQLTGLNVKKNATAYWARIASTIEKTGTPHSAILGNHDAEPYSGNGNQSSPGAFTNRTQLIAFDMTRKLSVTKMGPVELRPAVSVYVVDVWGEPTHRKGEVPVLQLYHLDSGGGGMLEQVHRGQIAWFNETISTRRSRYHPQVVPAMVFVHIPLTQFQAAVDQGASKCFGEHEDGITPTVSDTGLFTALEAAPEVKSVHVGHDHCNDFCCQFGARAVSLCFGRHSGRGGYDCKDPATNATFAHGARVMTITAEPFGIDTHVRLEDGTHVDGGRIG